MSGHQEHFGHGWPKPFMLAQERTEAVGCGAHIQAIGGSGVGGVATAVA
jgi:hypothetical protein